jgi:protein-S-isoprenylcysteine O-methyltransferase Ste14
MFTMSFDLRWVLSAIWILVAAIWVVAAIGTKRAVKRQSVKTRVVEVACLLAALELLFNSRLFHSPLWPGILHWRVVPDEPLYGWLSLSITCAGMAFTVWARFFLGRNWSGLVTVKQNHELIRGGPYRIVRHPIYTGLSVAFLGTAIGFGELRGLVGLPILVFGWKHKANVEERFMTEQFGEQYERYRRAVKGLIPFVW